MRAARCLVGIALMLSGCAASHGLDGRAEPLPEDAGFVALDAATPDASDPDRALTSADGGLGETPCGPNTCYHGEACCSVLCGFCAPAELCGAPFDPCD
ncbi:MAG: hypothetical protein AB8I08_35670 [Sandaracinaceae bacterium]